MTIRPWLAALVALTVWSCTPGYKVPARVPIPRTINSFDAITRDLLQKVASTVAHARPGNSVQAGHALEILDRQYIKTHDSYLSWRAEPHAGADSPRLGGLVSNIAQLMSALAAYHAAGGQ